jgi:hypothetical protein
MLRYEIPEHIREKTTFALREVAASRAPTGIGFQDIALMIAYGEQEEDRMALINSGMLCKFLHGNQSAPETARLMQPSTAQRYLDSLSSVDLIEHTLGDGYQMQNGVAQVLRESARVMKSPHVDELLFRGFKIFVNPASAKKTRVPRRTSNWNYGTGREHGLSYRTGIGGSYLNW